MRFSLSQSPVPLWWALAIEKCIGKVYANLKQRLFLKNISFIFDRFLHTWSAKISKKLFLVRYSRNDSGVCHPVLGKIAECVTLC